MADATIVALIGAASPLVISLAALIKAYANGVETRTNAAHIEQLHSVASGTVARLENLEIGNLADAAANAKNGEKP